MIFHLNFAHNFQIFCLFSFCTHRTVFSFPGKIYSARTDEKKNWEKIIEKIFFLFFYRQKHNFSWAIFSLGTAEVSLCVLLESVCKTFDTKKKKLIFHENYFSLIVQQRVTTCAQMFLILLWIIRQVWNYFLRWSVEHKTKKKIKKNPNLLMDKKARKSRIIKSW